MKRLLQRVSASKRFLVARLYGLRLCALALKAKIRRTVCGDKIRKLLIPLNDCAALSILRGVRDRPMLCAALKTPHADPPR
jgi:hypothetical protein